MVTSVQSALAPRPAPELKAYLLWSTAGHAVLLAVVLGWSAWKAEPRIDLNQKPIIATLVRRGQARDPKLLPRLETPPSPPKAAPPPAIAPAPPSQKPAPHAPPAARAAPRAEDPAARRSRLMDAFARTSQRAHDEPLEGAPDGDPEGDSATAEGEQYYGILRRDVKRHYDVSHAIPDQERLHLKTDVLLKVDARGAVELVKLASGSGNELFDNAVLAAVKRATPFPAPPAHLRAALHEEGVVLRFTP